MTTRHLLLLLLLAACGTAPGPAPADAGTDAGPTACAGDSDCAPGAYCLGQLCGSCAQLGCSPGLACTASGACTAPLDAGVDAGSFCLHRQECPYAQACLGPSDGGGTCGSPDPTAACGSSDQCPKANLCQAHLCVPGCVTNLDCHGTSSPRCLPGNPGHCAPCVATTDCQPGETCTGGHCLLPDGGR